MDQKMTGSKKIFFIQKSVFSCLLTRRNDFWNPFILRSYFHNCLPGLLSHIANQLSLLTKKYLTSKVHFDIIYLKMTENARSVTTENTLIYTYTFVHIGPGWRNMWFVSVHCLKRNMAVVFKLQFWLISK